MAKRANGEGSIFQRKSDGRYSASISAGKGKRKHFLGRTRGEVAAKLAAALKNQDDRLPVRLESQKFSVFIKNWLDGVKGSLRPRTWQGYEQLMRCHAIPALGTKTLEKVKEQDLQNLYTSLLAGGTSTSRVRQLHAVLHRAFKQALRWSLVARNVADAVTPPTPRRLEMKTLSPSEARKFLEAAQGHRYEALFVLAITTGMRQGELLGLRWEDVDWAHGTIRVQRSLQRTKEGFMLVEPKTSRSRRQIALTDLAREALDRHRVNQTAERLLAGASPQKLDLVFTNSAGGPLDGTHLLRQAFYPLLSRAGLPRIRFHDLRHTAATLLLGQGIHPKIVSEMLGHSTIAITLDLYSHVTPTMQVQAAATMDALLNSY